MYHKYAHQPRTIVIVDDDDSVKAVQPKLRPATLSHRDAHGQLTECQASQRETPSPLTSSDLKRLSRTPQKSVLSPLTKRGSCTTAEAAYDTTGRWQPKIIQDEPSRRLESDNTHLPLCIPTPPEDGVCAIELESEAPCRDPLSQVTYKGCKDIVTIDLDLDDESDFSTSMTDIIAEDDHHEQKRSPASVPSLDLSETMYETLDRVSSDNRTLKAGKTVEIPDGEFLRIQSVVRDIATTEIFLQGHRLRRANKMNGLLELKRNEVVMILVVEETDPRPVMVKGIEQVPLAQIGRIRELVITNRPFPKLSFREHAHELPSDAIILKYGRLVCRWKYIVSSGTAKDKRWNKYPEKCLTRFGQSEIDSCSAESDDLLRQYWRGDTVRGGACLGMPPAEEDFDRKERAATQASECISPTVSHRFPISTVREPTQSTGSKSSKSSKTTAEFAKFSTSMSSSTPTGNRSGPFTVLDYQTETSVPPSTQGRLPGQASGHLRQQARRQTIIDITGDESPKISLEPLSLGGSRGQPPRRDCCRAGETVQSPRHHNVRPQSSGVAGFVDQVPDITEISAEVAAKSASGLYMTKYIGALPSHHDSFLHSKKRLKTTHRGTTMSPIMDNDYLLDSRPGNSGELWPAKSVPLVERPASAKLKDQILAPGIALEEPKPKTPAQATLFSAQPAKRSIGQRTVSKQHPTATKSRQKQRYTFGDAFCGAGGTSRGAKSAGFRVQWGLDFDFAAITSYRLNFYNTDCIVGWVHDFAGASAGDEHKVDILHLSPPCQVFSPAHTVDGKDDEMNTATFFAVGELVRLVKPRVVTLENTSGLPILHPLWLNSAIHIFTRLGFSVRWKIMNFAEYGLVQARKRLVIIASCPGEGLPAFPKPTHGTGLSGLTPFVTVQNVISRIPRGFANHDPDSARKRNEPPYPANEPLRACITCSGGGNYHPSGKRDLTLREYACLQGFPLEHKFGPTRVKKQIGNAVPPSFAKILFEEIKKTLLKADGF